MPIPLREVDRLIAIGSDGMMRGVREARHAALKPYLMRVRFESRAVVTSAKGGGPCPPYGVGTKKNP